MEEKATIDMILEQLRIALKDKKAIQEELEENNVAKYFVEVGNYEATIEIKKKED